MFTADGRRIRIDLAGPAVHALPNPLKQNVFFSCALSLARALPRIELMVTMTEHPYGVHLVCDP